MDCHICWPPEETSKVLSGVVVLDAPLSNEEFRRAVEAIRNAR